MAPTNMKITPISRNTFSLWKRDSSMRKNKEKTNEISTDPKTNDQGANSIQMINGIPMIKEQPITNRNRATNLAAIIWIGVIPYDNNRKLTD
jgi:hypothetical protein